VKPSAKVQLSDAREKLSLLSGRLSKPKVALMGAPGVGKSTLLNHMIRDGLRANRQNVYRDHVDQNSLTSIEPRVLGKADDDAVRNAEKVLGNFTTDRRVFSEVTELRVPEEHEIRLYNIQTSTFRSQDIVPTSNKHRTTSVSTEFHFGKTPKVKIFYHDLEYVVNIFHEYFRIPADEEEEGDHIKLISQVEIMTGLDAEELRDMKEEKTLKIPGFFENKHGRILEFVHIEDTLDQCAESIRQTILQYAGGIWSLMGLVKRVEVYLPSKTLDNFILLDTPGCEPTSDTNEFIHQAIVDCLNTKEIHMFINVTTKATMPTDVIDAFKSSGMLERMREHDHMHVINLLSEKEIRDLGAELIDCNLKDYKKEKDKQWIGLLKNQFREMELTTARRMAEDIVTKRVHSRACLVLHPPETIGAPTHITNLIAFVDGIMKANSEETLRSGYEEYAKICALLLSLNVDGRPRSTRSDHNAVRECKEQLHLRLQRKDIKTNLNKKLKETKDPLDFYKNLTDKKFKAEKFLDHNSRQLSQQMKSQLPGTTALGRMLCTHLFDTMFSDTRRQLEKLSAEIFATIEQQLEIYIFPIIDEDERSNLGQKVELEIDEAKKMMGDVDDVITENQDKINSALKEMFGKLKNPKGNLARAQAIISYIKRQEYFWARNLISSLRENTLTLLTSAISRLQTNVGHILDGLHGHGNQTEEQTDVLHEIEVCLYHLLERLIESTHHSNIVKKVVSEAKIDFGGYRKKEENEEPQEDVEKFSQESQDEIQILTPIKTFTCSICQREKAIAERATVRIARCKPCYNEQNYQKRSSVKRKREQTKATKSKKAKK